MRMLHWYVCAFWLDPAISQLYTVARERIMDRRNHVSSRRNTGSRCVIMSLQGSMGTMITSCGSSEKPKAFFVPMNKMGTKSAQCVFQVRAIMPRADTM